MGRINVASQIFAGLSEPQQTAMPRADYACGCVANGPNTNAVQQCIARRAVPAILAEGAIALSVTLSGGALFAS